MECNNYSVFTTDKREALNNSFSFSYSLSFLYLALVLSLFFTFVGTQFAFAQCNVLCQHKRGEASFENGDSITKNGQNYLKEPTYEIALEDEEYTEVYTTEDEDKLLVETEADNMDTTYIDAPSKKWHFSIIPYGWFMGLNGKLGVGGQTVDLDVSFFDILENLDIAAEVHAEAWRDRFGFFIDGTFSKITLKKDAQLRFDRSIKLKSVTKFFLGEFAGFYRVGTWPVGSMTGSTEGKTKKSFTFDMLGGGRYWWMKNKIDIKGPIGVLNPDFSASKDWFDFIVGGRVKFDINKFFIALRTDIGGFGLGFSSDISWNIAGYFGYELPWYHITPIIGYRALYDKYDSGSGNNRFLWDAWMYGPQLGLAFQF